MTVTTTSTNPSTNPSTNQAEPRVLVVDDSIDAAETLAMLLETKGCAISTALDGASALEAFARVEPQLVLLDVGLPDMDGFEVARAMSDRNPSALLVALTGFGDAQTRAAVERSCFHRHLLKPVDFKVLDELLMLARGAAAAATTRR